MINVIHVLGIDLGIKEESGTMCTLNPYVMMNKMVLTQIIKMLNDKHTS